MRASECAPSRVRSSCRSAWSSRSKFAPHSISSATRGGPFGDQRLGGGAVNQAVACVHGVFKVQGNVFVAFHGDGDAALRVVGVRLAQRLLGDHQHIAVLRQLHGGAQPGHTRAHYQKIDLSTDAIHFQAITGKKKQHLASARSSLQTQIARLTLRREHSKRIFVFAISPPWYFFAEKCTLRYHRNQ